jgi:hypothetical protein
MAGCALAFFILRFVPLFGLIGFGGFFVPGIRHHPSTLPRDQSIPNSGELA